MAPVKRRTKPKEPKKEKKDAYASVFVHMPTKMCVCIFSFQMQSGIDVG